MIKNALMVSGWLAACIAFCQLSYWALIPPNGLEIREAWNQQMRMAAGLCGLVAGGCLLYSVWEAAFRPRLSSSMPPIRGGERGGRF